MTIEASLHLWVGMTADKGSKMIKDSRKRQERSECLNSQLRGVGVFMQTAVLVDTNQANADGQEDWRSD